jgi:hypothetical protein
LGNSDIHVAYGTEVAVRNRIAFFLLLLDFTKKEKYEDERAAM